MKTLKVPSGEETKEENEEKLQRLVDYIAHLAQAGNLSYIERKQKNESEKVKAFTPAKTPISTALFYASTNDFIFSYSCQNGQKRINLPSQ